MKLLVVDDSAIARKFLIKSLPTDIEFEIRECVNGLECVQAYPEYQPDLVFLDLTMPEMTGLEALERLKQIDESAIVFVLTADIQKSTYDNVMSLGASKFIKKPPTKDTISAAVYEYRDFLQSRKGDA